MRDLKHLIYFENLLQEANNELVQQAKAEGEHALGYTCYFVPETLLNLPGCFSSRLRAPNTGSIDVGTYYMSSKICSYTRSILERGIEGGYDYLDALLSSETCQMMHRGHEHFEILGLVKEKNPQFFMSMMDVPFSDEDFAVDHYEEQLRVHVLEPLHETYGIDISDKAIRAAIRDHNEISRVMTEIGDLRKAANPVITGYEFHVLQLVSQVCPHKRILPYLKQTLTELKIHTQFSANGGSIAYLQNANGETQLELIGMPEGETVKASGMFLCFGTEDIASAHERAVLHGMNPSDIRQPEPDARYFYVYDPDGLSVQVREYR